MTQINKESGKRKLDVATITTDDSINDYDPHYYRNVEKPTTNWQSFAHFLKASIGTGVLAMPSAFVHAGYVNGIIFTILIGALALHCLHLLIGSMYELCKQRRRPYLSYSEAMRIGLQQGPPFLRCLTPIARPFVDGFLAFYHFGICSAYVVFIAESMKQIVDEYIIVLDAKIHMCILLLPLFLIFSIRNLKYLAPFSAAANICVLAGFGVIFYYIFSDLPPLSQRVPFEHISEFPIYFGIAVFALEAVGVVLAIEANMKTPKDYVTPFGVMNCAMAVVLSLYIFLGFFGYWRYGNESKGSVTLNIPNKSILAQIVKITFAVATWITYALQGYVPIDIVWNHYVSKWITDSSKKILYEYLVRAIIVFLTFLCAIIVPDLALFLSLVGALCISSLGFIFPPLLSICIQYHSESNLLAIIKNIVIIVFGIFAGVIGTYLSVIDLINTKQDNE